MTEYLAVALAGLGLGLLHSLDPDHLAAMSTLVGRERTGRGRDFGRGVLWGIGHTLALGMFGALLILIGAQVGGTLERAFEAAVGVLLILLGLHRLADLRRGPHLHPHRHGDYEHTHVHLHPVRSDHHAASAHARHSHAPLWIGLLHGIAGTGGVMVLVPAVVTGRIDYYLAYLGLFGLGSVLTMGLFCAGIGGFMRIAGGIRASAGRWLGAVAGTASAALGVFWIGSAVIG